MLVGMIEDTNMTRFFDDRFLRNMRKRIAYAEGYAAEKEEENHYNNEDEWELHEAWADGWLDACLNAPFNEENEDD